MLQNNSDDIKLSICIVNYNITDCVLALIESIHQNITSIVYEILVVDNASEDNPERITAQYEDVKLIKNNINLYFTKADNQNFLRAQGEYILSINPDTLITANAIENMIDFLKFNSEVGAVTPKFIFPNNEIQASFVRYLTFGSIFLESLNSLFTNKTNHLDELGKIFYDPDKIQEAEVLYGACIMFRREVLETVGFKDERLIHGWDEYDWCIRIKKAGWKLFYINNSVIIHYRSETVKNIKSDSKKIRELDIIGKNGYHYLIKKHFGNVAFIILRVIWALVKMKSLFQKFILPKNKQNM